MATTPNTEVRPARPGAEGAGTPSATAAGDLADAVGQFPDAGPQPGNGRPRVRG